MVGKGENLLLKIGALEAKQGLEPRIERSKYVKIGEDSDLTLLRQEKIQRHLYHIQKLLNKSAKKAKTFAIQKLVKKLKQVDEKSGEGDQKNDKTILEANLKQTKEIKIEPDFLMNKFQDKWTPYIKEKCPFISQSFNNIRNQSEESILDTIFKIKNFQTDLERLTQEFQQFLEKLFHENQVEADKKPKKRKNFPFKNGGKKPTPQSQDPAMFYFDRKKPQRSQFEGDDSMRKRKNRPGQRARRQMAERDESFSRDNSQKRSNFSREKTEKKAKQLNENSSANLHPSWKAAKEKTKVKFQGTKTVFSD
jgi:hypothetical protein